MDSYRLGELISVVGLDSESLVESLLSDGEIDSLKKIIRNGTPLNTLRAYVSDLTYLEAWCQAATGAALPWPAPQELVLKFIAHHADSSAPNEEPAFNMPLTVRQSLSSKGISKADKAHSISTIERRLATWGKAHVMQGYKNTIGIDEIRAVVAKAKKTGSRLKRPHSRKPITRDVLDLLLEQCDPSRLVGKRNRAILLTAFSSGGRRRSELTKLKVENLIQEDPVVHEGKRLACLTLVMGHPKTSRGNERQTVKLVGRSADALLEWTRAALIEDGPVFRGVDRWGRVSKRAITGSGINGIIKQLVKAADLNPTDFSAHGLRSGFLTQAGRDGHSLLDAMQQSQHRSTLQAARYYQPGAIETSGVVLVGESKSKTDLR